MRGHSNADRGLLAPYALTGRRLPARMLPEWKWAPLDSAPGMDEAEVEAFTEMVRAFAAIPAARPVNVFVRLVPERLPDRHRDAGRARRVQARHRHGPPSWAPDTCCSRPTNCAISRAREDSNDDWSWENLLWLGLGQKIRRDEWDRRRARSAVGAGDARLRAAEERRAAGLCLPGAGVLAETRVAARANDPKHGSVRQPRRARPTRTG